MESSVTTKSTFTNCKTTNGNGGAIYVDLGTSGKFAINEGTITENDPKTAFSNCQASLGQSLYIMSSATAVTSSLPSIIMKNTDFTSTSAKNVYMLSAVV